MAQHNILTTNPYQQIETENGNPFQSNPNTRQTCVLRRAKYFDKIFLNLARRSQRFEKRRLEHFHTELRHDFTHLLVRLCPGNALHLSAHLFKELFKSSGLAQQNQFGVVHSCIGPDVWDAAWQPDASSCRQLEGFVARLENKCPREHVMPFVFAMVHVQKRAGLRQGLQFKCRERSYCIFPSVFVEKANRLSPASPQQLCRSSPPLWTRALFELCIRKRNRRLAGQPLCRLYRFV
jgi:hypothetical protein